MLLSPALFVLIVRAVALYQFMLYLPYQSALFFHSSLWLLVVLVAGGRSPNNYPRDAGYNSCSPVRFTGLLDGSLLLARPRSVTYVRTLAGVFRFGRVRINWTYLSFLVAIPMIGYAVVWRLVVV